MITDRVNHYETFGGTALWDRNWPDIAKEFPVDRHRAALDETRFRPEDRARVFDEDIGPLFRWETFFVRVSLVTTLLALVVLPLLRGPRRTATALAAVSVVLLIFTAGFLSESAERYLSIIHGAAALSGALALSGIIEKARASRQRGKMLVTQVEG
jgi:hypothetical protein